MFEWVYAENIVALPFGHLWYAEPNAISYAKHRSQSHRAVIRVCDQTGNVIERVSKQTILGSCEFCRKQPGSADTSVAGYNCGLIKSQKLLLRAFVFRFA